MAKRKADPRSYSSVVFDGVKQTPSRAMLRAVGFDDRDFRRTQVGIASTWSTLTPCNMHIDRLADAAGLLQQVAEVVVRAGVGWRQRRGLLQRRDRVVAAAGAMQRGAVRDPAEGVSRIAVDPVGADRDHLVIPALIEVLHQLLDLGDGWRNGRGGHGGWRRLAHRLEKNQLQA